MSKFLSARELDGTRGLLPKGDSGTIPSDGANTRTPQLGEVLNAKVDTQRPTLPRSCPLGKVMTADMLETKPLVPGAQFLAGDAVPCPGDSLEAKGGNIFAARFAHAVSTTGTTCKRSLNFL